MKRLPQEHTAFMCPGLDPTLSPMTLGLIGRSQTQAVSSLHGKHVVLLGHREPADKQRARAAGQP